MSADCMRVYVKNVFYRMRGEYESPSVLFLLDIEAATLCGCGRMGDVSP